MSNYQLTDQEYAILAMVARGEAVKSDPYGSVWPGKVFPEIKSMTLSQLKEFQEKRKASGLKSDACGKYQFVGYMLWGCYWDRNRAYTGSGCDRGLIANLGVDMNTIFDKNFQDWLIIQRLKQLRGMEKWKAGSNPITKHTSDLSDVDIAFQVELCREFASLPLPVPRNGKARGDSYYNGALNKATGHHSPDEVYREIQRIRGKGPGEIKSLNVQTGEGVELGTDPYTRARKASGGGTTIYGGSTGRRETLNFSLPPAQNPYVYKPIDPEDTRYDFRLGEKVYELVVYGAAPASSKGFSQSRAPSREIGAAGISSEQAENIASKTTTAGDDVLFQQPVSQAETYVKTQTVQTPSGPKETYKVFKKVNTPAGIKEVEVKQPQLATSYVPEIQNTRPDGSGKNIIVNKKLPDAQTKTDTPNVTNSNVHNERVTPLSEKPSANQVKATPTISDFVLKSVYGDDNSKVAVVQNTKDNSTIKLTVNQRVWFNGAIVTEIIDGGLPANDKLITDQGEIKFAGSSPQ